MKSIDFNKSNINNIKIISTDTYTNISKYNVNVHKYNINIHAMTTYADKKDKTN